jgi:hypothetical protein
MAHPGHAGGEPIEGGAEMETRPLEFAYLASDAFRDLLRERGLALSLGLN